MSIASYVHMEEELTLPEELVGRILAKVPFPQILKTRILSKSWRARCSPISSQDDEKERHLATWFQEQVGESSSKWTTFYPVFISHENVKASDHTSQSWQRMLSLSFLPEHLFGPELWQMEGSLLLVRDLLIRNAHETWDLYIANIFTRSWKQLPPRPHEKTSTNGSPTRRFHTEQLLIYVKPAYKVIDLQIYARVVEDFFAQIYDSNLDAWSSIKVKVPRSNDSEFIISEWTHLDGVLYRMVGPTPMMARGLHAYSIQEGTFEILQMSSSVNRPCAKVRLVVCNASLFILMFKRVSEDGNYAADSVMVVTVVKIDLESRRWSEVTQGPPFALRYFKFSSRPGVDGDCIIFAGVEGWNGVIAYDVRKDEWSHSPGLANQLQYVAGDSIFARMVRKGPFCFQPGLNPFVAV